MLNPVYNYTATMPPPLILMIGVDRVNWEGLNPYNIA